ncbi:MAG TPA: DMT family protein [Planctomycetota bacterium]|nr:DMT family protein [Planctomycetota bacterium]
MRTILLLVASNVFMTVAWYGHLKFKQAPLLAVIVVSWLIALPEYALQVPANRWGHGVFTAFQLKILQEVITLVVFTVFAVLWLREPVKWNYLVAFLLLIGAVAFAFWPSSRPA